MRLLYSDILKPSFSMKVHFLVIQLWEKETNYQEVIKISKLLINSYKHTCISVQLWILANTIYAKALAKTENVAKSMLIYKSMAQVLPRLFIPDVEYTKELQHATSKEDLMNTSRPIRKQNISRKSIGYSEAVTDFDAKRARLIASRKNLSNLVINEEPENHMPISYSHDSHFKQADSEIHNDSVANLEQIGINPFLNNRISTMGETLKRFSVCTDYLFLYKIGKLAAKREMFQQDGFYALHDFLNIHHY